MDGEPTRTTLPGYNLLHQYQTADGYLLVTDMDCPFEETTHFVLLSPSLRILSSRFLGLPYQSWLLKDFRAIDARRFEATFYDDHKWLIRIHRGGIPFIFPRITLQRVQAR